MHGWNCNGLALGNLGFTHCCVEDIGILRSIPNIQIISPADSFETIKALNAAVGSNKSTYIRLTGSSNNPIVYNQDYNLEIGKSKKLRIGKYVSLFCSGTMVSACLDAAINLEKLKISCSVINMHTIKPVDVEAIKDASVTSKLIVSVEEHNIIGGLGSAISEELSKLDNHPKMIRIGINDQYTKGGSYNFLKDKYGLTQIKSSRK